MGSSDSNHNTLVYFYIASIYFVYYGMKNKGLVNLH